MKYDMNELCREIRLGGASSRLLKDFCSNVQRNGTADQIDTVRQALMEAGVSGRDGSLGHVFDFICDHSNADASCSDLDYIMRFINAKGCGSDCVDELTAITRLAEAYPSRIIPYICDKGYACNLIRTLTYDGSDAGNANLSKLSVLFSVMNARIRECRSKESPYYDMLLYDDELFSTIADVLESFPNASESTAEQIWLLDQALSYLRKSVDSNTLFDNNLESVADRIFTICSKGYRTYVGYGTESSANGSEIIAEILHLLGVKISRNRPELFRKIINLERSEDIYDVTDLNVAIYLNRGRHRSQESAIDAIFSSDDGLRQSISDTIDCENAYWMNGPKIDYDALIAESCDVISEKNRLNAICTFFRSKLCIKGEHISLLLSVMKRSLETPGLDSECLEQSINSLALLLKHTIDIDYMSSNTTVDILKNLEIAYGRLGNDSQISIDGTLVDHIDEILNTGLDYLFAPALKLLHILADRGTIKIESVFSMCRGRDRIPLGYDDPGFPSCIIPGFSDPEARLSAAQFMNRFFQKKGLIGYSEDGNVLDTLMWMLCDGTKSVKDGSISAMTNILHRISISGDRCRKIFDWIEFHDDPVRNSMNCKLIYFMIKSGSIDTFDENHQSLVDNLLVRIITARGQEDAIFWSSMVFTVIPPKTESLTTDTIISIMRVVSEPHSDNIEDITLSTLMEAVHHIGSCIKSQTACVEQRKTIRCLARDLIHYRSNLSGNVVNSLSRMLCTLSENRLWNDSGYSQDDYSIIDAIVDVSNILVRTTNTAVMYWLLKMIYNLMESFDSQDKSISKRDVDVISATFTQLIGLRERFTEPNGYEDYGVRAQIAIVIESMHRMSESLFSADDPRLIGIWDTEGDSAWEVQRHSSENNTTYANRFERYSNSMADELLDLFEDDSKHGFEAGTLRFGLKSAAQIYTDRAFLIRPDSHQRLLKLTESVIKHLREQMELLRTYMGAGIRKECGGMDSVTAYKISLFDYGIVAEISKTLNKAIVKTNVSELEALCDRYGLISMFNSIISSIPDFGTVKHTFRALDELASKGIYSGSTVQVIMDHMLVVSDGRCGITKDYGVVTAALKTMSNILSNIVDEGDDALMPLKNGETIQISVFEPPLVNFPGDNNIMFLTLQCIRNIARCGARMEADGLMDTLIDMTLSFNPAIRRKSSKILGHIMNTADDGGYNNCVSKLAEKYRGVMSDDRDAMHRILDSLSVLSMVTNRSLDGRFDFTPILDDHPDDRTLIDVVRTISSELSIHGPTDTLDLLTSLLVRGTNENGYVPTVRSLVLMECITQVLGNDDVAGESLTKAFDSISGPIAGFMNQINKDLSGDMSGILKRTVPGCPGYDYYRVIDIISGMYLVAIERGGADRMSKEKPLAVYLELFNGIKDAEGTLTTKQYVSFRILLSKVIFRSACAELRHNTFGTTLWTKILYAASDNVKCDNDIVRYNSLATIYIGQTILESGSVYETWMNKAMRIVDNNDLIIHRDNMSIARLSTHIVRRFSRNGMIDLRFFDNIRDLMENNSEPSMSEAMEMIPILDVIAGTFISILREYSNDLRENRVMGLNIMQYNDLKRSLVAASYILSTASYLRMNGNPEGIRYMSARIKRRSKQLREFEKDPKYAIPLMKYMTKVAMEYYDLDQKKSEEPEDTDNSDQKKSEEPEDTDNSEPLKAVNQAYMIVYTFPEMIASSEKEVAPSIDNILKMLSSVCDRYDGLLSLASIGRMKHTDSDSMGKVMEILIGYFKMDRTKQEQELTSECIYNMSSAGMNLDQGFIDRYVMDRLSNRTIFFSTANNMFKAVNAGRVFGAITPEHYCRLMDYLMTQTVPSTFYPNAIEMLENLINHMLYCYDPSHQPTIPALIDKLIHFIHPNLRDDPRRDNLRELMDRIFKALGIIYQQTGCGIPQNNVPSLLRRYSDGHENIKIQILFLCDIRDPDALRNEYRAILDSASVRCNEDVCESLAELIYKMASSGLFDEHAFPIMDKILATSGLPFDCYLTVLESMILYVKMGYRPFDIGLLEDRLGNMPETNDSEKQNLFRTKLALILYYCLDEKSRRKVLNREAMVNIDMYVKDDRDRKDWRPRWMRFGWK